MGIQQGILGVVLALGLSGTAVADELVRNGTFETGDFTGWTQSRVQGSTAVGAATTPGWGNFTAYLGPNSATGTLTQTLATIVGEVYRWSFDFSGNKGVGVLAEVVNGNLAFKVSSAFTSFNPTSISNTFIATGDKTVLSFEYQRNVGPWSLDNVSVTGRTVPGPVAGAGFPALLAIGAFAVWRRRRAV